MKKKWYQDNKLNTSSLRVIGLIVSIIGGIMALSGVVAMFMSLESAATAMTTSSIMLTALPVAKAWQKQMEGKKDVEENK